MFFLKKNSLEMIHQPSLIGNTEPIRTFKGATFSTPGPEGNYLLAPLPLFPMVTALLMSR